MAGQASGALANSAQTEIRHKAGLFHGLGL